jgi:hypothetical protein
MVQSAKLRRFGFIRSDLVSPGVDHSGGLIHFDQANVGNAWSNAKDKRPKLRRYGVPCGVLRRHSDADFSKLRLEGLELVVVEADKDR